MDKYTKLDQQKIIDIIFHPRKVTKTLSAQNHFDIDIPVEENVNLGCRLFISDPSSPVIIYFHGNGETVDDYEVIAPRYLESGLNFLILTYRGYGWSHGSPSVTNMMKDSCTVLEAAKNILHDKGFTGPLFIMGRSIGTAAAIEVCTSHSEDIKGLILESGFADTLPLLANLGCPAADVFMTEEEGFGNREKIAAIKTPTLILHGALDSIIPIHQAERLQAFSGARTKKFFVVPGADHNTVIQVGGDHYFSTILSFINDITGEASWRKRRKKYRAEEK